MFVHRPRQRICSNMPVQIINAGPRKCEGYLGASAIRKYGKMVKEGHLTDFQVEQMLGHTASLMVFLTDSELDNRAPLVEPVNTN